MKKIVLFASLFVFVACKKSNDAPVAYAHAEVLSAAVVNSNLQVQLTVQESAQMKSCNLVVYRTGPQDVDYRYPITLKDGPQTVLCNKWTLTSPMQYQIEYYMNSGDHNFSPMMSVGY